MLPFLQHPKGLNQSKYFFQFFLSLPNDNKKLLNFSKAAKDAIQSTDEVMNDLLEFKGVAANPL